MPIDIVLISAFRALLEVAGLMMLARGLMWLFGRTAREGNFIYAILTIGTLPFFRLTRAMSPRFIRDAYIPAIAFVLVFCVWIATGIAKEWMCVSRALQCA